MVAMLAACADEPGVDPLVLAGPSMGTTWRVEVATLPQRIAPEALEAELAEILRSVDERMSTYRPDSELSRFNRSRSVDWFPVSADTARVVEASLDLSARTGGAFDVTVGPLVSLFGFGPGPPPAEAPTPEQRRAAHASVGAARLAARSDPPALRMQVPERLVDLSAIAKGFAVDLLAEHLEARGIESYLVELGGELRAGARRPNGEPWRVGIERPREGRGARGTAGTLALERRAVATSGDYRDFRVLDGERVAHVLDPRSGLPVHTGVRSATVVSASAMEADGFATALMVLGPDEGLALAEREGLAVRLLVSGDGELLARSTPAFDALLVGRPAGSALGRFLAALIVLLLAMAGLGAGLLLRGRALRAGCAGERCPAPCSASPCAAHPSTDPRANRQASEA